MRVEEERGRAWGLLGEFETPDELLHTARPARAEGYRRMDAYTPFPIHGLSDAMGFRPTKLPLFVLAGAVIGCVAALGTSIALAATFVGRRRLRRIW